MVTMCYLNHVIRIIVRRTTELHSFSISCLRYLRVITFHFYFLGMRHSYFTWHRFPSVYCCLLCDLRWLLLSLKSIFGNFFPHQIRHIQTNEFLLGRNRILNHARFLSLFQRVSRFFLSRRRNIYTQSDPFIRAQSLVQNVAWSNKTGYFVYLAI